MVAEIEIKLQDLAKLALGTPQLTNVNVAILQSLLEILLKKLNCHNEIVFLNAYEGKHLENLLKTAKTSPIVFNDENVEIVSDKLERLNKLQENVQKLEKKLNRHLQEIQGREQFNETVVDLEIWPSNGCEHPCSACEPENELACQILKDADFLKKLQRRLTAPVVERLFHFEAKIEKLNEEFTDFIKRTREVYSNMQLLEKCAEEIEKLRDLIEGQKKLFVVTMEEIQDMLDSKLDKIHVPALKKYIRDNFQEIDQSINMLQAKQKCPRAAGIIMEGLRCVSCGNVNVGSEIGGSTAVILPDAMPKNGKTMKYCGASNDYMNTKKLALASGNLDALFDGSEFDHKGKGVPKYRQNGNEVEWLKSVDGKLYRKDY